RCLSDWSSDVCSSDLIATAAATTTTARAAFTCLGARVRRLGARHGVREGLRLHGLVVGGFRGRRTAWLALGARTASAFAAGLAKIGRAACRGRVWRAV